jgi:hypothetical protein
MGRRKERERLEFSVVTTAEGAVPLSTFSCLARPGSAFQESETGKE